MFKSSATKKTKPAPRKESIAKGRMQIRVVSLAFIVALLFLILVGRLWYLQVLTGKNYTLTAQATHTREIKVPAQRGVIMDRNGTVLANNKPGLNVTVIPSDISRDRLAKLADLLGADKATVLARYDAAKNETTGNLYEPILVKENAGRDAVTYISERTDEFRGVAVNNDYIRNYPKDGLAAHILGYTGAVTADELKQEPYKGLPKDAVVGQAGAEYSYQKWLSGKPGTETYNVDALGRVVPAGSKLDSMGRFVTGSGISSKGVDPLHARPSQVTDPVPGDNLKLTIDAGLQQNVQAELAKAISLARQRGDEATGGAAIAMNPNNGQILAMSSLPSFNPQMFVGGITGNKEIKKFDYLNSAVANAPFTDRAISGVYPAASTFKTFTGLAGLFYGAITPQTTYTDNGACWRPMGVLSGCWQSWREFNGTGTVHGTQDLAQAIMDSNDKYFYQVADLLWNKTKDENLLPKFYEKFGFGSKTNIDLPNETSGLVPTSQWQQASGPTAADKYWSIGRWVNLAIGQGDLQVSPIQLLRAYAAVDNGGTLVTPHVGMDITNPDGKTVKKIDPKPERKINVSDQALASVRQGLDLVTSPEGTAGAQFTGSPLKVAGKTGTAQTSQGTPTGWFVGWADNEKKPLIVLVVVEHGGNGEGTSDVAVRNILEKYYGVAKKGNQPPSQVNTSPQAVPPSPPSGGLPPGGLPTVGPSSPGQSGGSPAGLPSGG